MTCNLKNKIIGAASLALLAIPLQAATLYVDVNGVNPVPPYTGWSTAATDIQSAVDVSTYGDTILVTNGLYAAGGRKWVDSGTNRVTVTNNVTLRSVNGPAATTIAGVHAAGTNAVRCILFTGAGFLSGFTLTNGQAGVGNYPQGGGVYCYSTATIVSNCVLAGNFATAGNGSGGGVFRGTLINCVLKNNAAYYGGASDTTTLTNCLVLSNTATLYGGGCYGGMLYNCTLVGNIATNSGGGVYGGSGAWLYNSIVCFNYAPTGPNLIGTKCNYGCSWPLAIGDSNITNDPVFVNPAGGDFHLQPISRCINSGTNAFVYATTDLDGNPRIRGGGVDMGAYEFQAQVAGTFNSWLLQLGLPTDGTADNSDTDGDGMMNWQEWIAGTNPTNSASVLKLSAPASDVSGINVAWQSVSGITYYLQSSTNLSAQPPFTSIQSNIVGRAGSTSFTDTSATNGGPYFYRVSVQ